MPTINRKNIQHVIFYECQDFPRTENMIPEGDCLNNFYKQSYCNTISFVWTFGGSLVIEILLKTIIYLTIIFKICFNRQAKCQKTQGK